MLIYKKMIRLSSPHYMLGRRHTASLACSTLHTYKRTQTHFIGTHADTDAHYHWRTVQAGWEKEREGRRKGWRGRMLRHREVIILGCACAHTHTHRDTTPRHKHYYCFALNTVAITDIYWDSKGCRCYDESSAGESKRRHYGERWRLSRLRLVS